MQWIEALVKNASFYSESGKGKANISNLSMYCSIMIKNCINEVKLPTEWKESK